VAASRAHHTIRFRVLEQGACRPGRTLAVIGAGKTDLWRATCRIGSLGPSKRDAQRGCSTRRSDMSVRLPRFPNFIADRSHFLGHTTQNLVNPLLVSLPYDSPYPATDQYV
jgi:hypothetical protein